MSAGRQAEDRFRDTLEGMPSAVVVVDRAGRIVLVNELTERIFGYERSELLDHPVEMLVPERLRSKHPEVRTQFFAAPSRRPLGSGRDLFGLRKDGTEVPIEIGLSPIHFDQGVLVLASVVDITQRKRAENELREVIAERDRFFDSSRDMLVVAGTDGYFKRVSPSCERTLGWTEAEMTSRPYMEFIHPDDRGATVREAGSIEGGLEAIEFENRYLAKDGSYRWLSWNSRLDRPGGSFHYAIARDVTERKRAERELREARDALEIANRELDAFSYSVSHDLRAPLRSIHGFSQAILEDNAGKLDPETESNFRRVQAAATRMGQLVDDLLMLSRITRSEVVRQPVDLSAVAGEVASDLRQHEPQRQVDLLVGEGLTAEGDPRLLRVVLENLLGNAWKYTSKLPRASIEFGAVEEDGERRFFVRDNGAGFDMAYAGKLFGVFQRLHAESEFSGTGIGLATVARVVHRHGGRIWAEAAERQGATFWFTLPAEAGKGGLHGEQAADPAGR